MSFCIICSLCGLHRSQEINPGQQHPLPSELTKELEDSRKFALNSLMTFLAVLALPGSRLLQPVVLALLIYTISLRLAINVCFLQDYPTLSIFLHAIPLLGTFCMAGIELILDMQSPALAVVVLFLSVLPLITTLVHHGRRCVEPAVVVLPIRMRGPLITMSGSADMTVASSSTDSVTGARRCDMR